MKTNSKRFLSIILAGILAASSMTALSFPAKADETDISATQDIPAQTDSTDTQDIPADYGLADSIQEGTILHCFTWKYRDIKAELPSIAEAGFTSIQVSPAQNSFYEYYPWYIVYQPFGLKFFDPTGMTTEGGFYMDRNAVNPSQFNTRAELEELCAEAEKYGINIIMDVVANHLAKEILILTGDELAKDEYWHPDKQISNYNRRSSITNGSLSGLKDLNTENEYVQKLALEYCLDLKSMGVDGIRWDAAKHIALPSEGSDFWKVVTDNGLYNYGEILGGPVDNKDHDELMAEYTQYMSVTDSDYGNNVSMSFVYKKCPSSDGNWTKRGVTADKLVYWSESHDTFSNGQPGSCDASQDIIDRGYAIVAARADATSLYFSRPDSIIKSEICEGDKGSMHYVAPEVSAVNHFHNAMIGKQDCYASNEKCCVVTRENGGAVIVCADETGEMTIENAGGYAVPGTYIDEVSGNTFVVTEDTITGTVGETGIAVIYDSPYIGKIYAEGKKSNTFNSEMSVTLRSAAADDAYSYYRIYRTVYHGDTADSTEIESSKPFKNGDVVDLGRYTAKYPEGACEYTIELTGTSVNGRELNAKYNYNYDPEYREMPDVSKRLTHITFDNSTKNWDEVYVNIDSDSEKMTDQGSGYFTYTLPEKYNNGKAFTVTFSDGKGNILSESNGKYMVMSYASYGIVDENSDWISNFYGVVGDANGDGKVTSKDALSIMRYSISGSNTGMSEFADIDMDDQISAKDAMLILRYTVNLPDKYGIGMALAL